MWQPSKTAKSLALNALKTFFSDKSEILSQKGFGDVYKAFIGIKTGYKIYKKFSDIGFSNGKTWLSYQGKTNAKDMYDMLKELDFSDSGIKKRAVKKSIKAVETACKDLLNHLYDYIYDVDTGDPDNKTFIEKTKDWATGLWDKVIMACPVDFEVYDADGNLIGYVDGSDLHDEYVFFTDDIFIKVEGDIKYLYYPSDMKVQIKVIPYEDGEMNFSIEKYDCGKAVNKAVYLDIPLSEGEAYNQVIPENADLSNASETVTTIGNIFGANKQCYNTTEKAYVNIKCVSTLGGTVIFDKEKPVGATETMIAVPDVGYELSYWMIDDKCVSTESIYRFTARKDVDIVAVFKKPSYVITFNANGGTFGNGFSKASYIVRAGERIPEIELPEKSGFVFSKWSSNIPEIMPENDVALTAEYIEPTTEAKAIISFTSPQTTVTRGEYISVTVVTTDDINTLRFRSVSADNAVTNVHFKVGVADERLRYSDENGLRTWNIQLRLSFAGNEEYQMQTWALQYYDESAYCWRETEHKAEVRVEKYKKTESPVEGVPAYSVISLEAPEGVKKGTYAEIVIITTNDAARVLITLNGKSNTYLKSSKNVISATENSDGTTTWGIKYRFGTAGENAISAQARGNKWSTAIALPHTVTVA